MLRLLRLYSKTVINMPALSPTMTKGNLLDWKKKVGDKVEAGEILIEVETDKATMDLEAMEDGYIAKLYVPNGAQDVEVNTPICVLVDSPEEVASFVDESTPETQKPQKTEKTSQEGKKAENITIPTANPPAPKNESEISSGASFSSMPLANGSNRLLASPVARKIAKESNINLESVPGTGPSGRITKFDVQEFLKHANTGSKVQTQQEQIMPISAMRKTIADRLLYSKQTIPHYYLTSVIDMSVLDTLRQKMEIKVSLNDFIVKASALAMKQVPTLNSTFENGILKQFASTDISVAVSTDHGLITPIVFGAEKLSVSEISSKIKDLAIKARSKKLTPQEYQGGTFTISNLGMYGIDHFSAIINPPQVAILAVGGLSDSLMKVTLSCDHRIVDGAVGAQWLQRFKEYLENPLLML